jgi:hypothetical protein
MIFGYVVAAMEKYLFTVFVQKIFNSQQFKNKFISQEIKKTFLSVTLQHHQISWMKKY